MAKKPQVSFVCQECGYDSPAFMGKCPECGSWNSMKEFHEAKSSSKGSDKPTALFSSGKPQKLVESAKKEIPRMKAKSEELNTVLGGGIVPGSVILLAGDPGVGKSTLLLQLCLTLSEMGKTILYISGEESVEQISLRAARVATNEKQKENLLLLSLSDPDQAIVEIEALKPDLVIVDSIQTMESERAGGLAGSVGQVRYAALTFVRTAKSQQIPVILVGHVTKEGMVAGPMVLSHMVDTVLFLEGEKFTKTRILRSLKNRFGPVDEVGLFLMDENGMTDVTSPEQLFLSEVSASTPGSVLVATLEGSRAFLVEIQALVVSSRLPLPRRVVSGMDQRRVELLLAVLQKHAKLPLDSYDVFVNVAGGLKLSDPGVDLGVCLAVYSSMKNIPLPKTVGIGEVGLLGEIRSIPSLDKRVREATKLGLTNLYTAQDYKRLTDVIMALEKGK
jgi:DNA repair protein RadA/Sms